MRDLITRSYWVESSRCLASIHPFVLLRISEDGVQTCFSSFLSFFLFICCDWHRRPLQPDGWHAPKWQTWPGVNGGPVIWLRGRLLTSGVALRQRRHLRTPSTAQFVTFNVTEVSRQTAYTLEGRLWDGNQKELWLLMTGCAACYGKPCCVSFTRAPLWIYLRE